jgi:hypothetical protein
MSAYKPRVYNGLRRRHILRSRRLVLAKAYKQGFITNAQASKIGKWQQSWYHLNALAEAGFLEHDGYNRWRKNGPGRPKVYNM